MIELSRIVRFNIGLDREAGNPSSDAQHNTFAGWPSMEAIGVYCELEVICRGEVDPVTGYMMNISAIDKAARARALPIIVQAVHRRPPSQPGSVLIDVLESLQPALQESVVSVGWRLNPYYSVSMAASSPHRIMIRQQFEFAASHRLHVAELSDAENRATFGKCNNPNGHGHNYRVEPAVLVALSNAGQSVPMTLPTLEKIVDETLIRRFDHKHLNSDVPEFARLNPSVENIAKVCFDLLAPAIAGGGGELDHITVWETEKTSCRYPAT